MSQRIAGVVLLTAAPLVVATLLAIGQLTQAAREAQLSSLRYSAQAIAAGLDGHLDKLVALAEGLADSPNLLKDDLGDFEIEARRVFARVQDSWIIVADRDGRQLLNTFDPDRAEPLPPRHPKAIEAQARAFAKGAPVLSGVRIGPVSGLALATIEAPVFKDGAPFRVLALTLTMRPLNRLLAAQDMPKGWLAGIIDADGLYAARVPEGERLAGVEAAPGWRATRGKTGRFEFAARDGAAVVDENVVSAFGGWTVGVAVAKEALDAAAFQTTKWSIVGALALLAASLTAALALARGVTRPLRELTAYVRDPSYRVAQPFFTRQPEVEELRRALAQARDEGAHNEMRQAKLLEATSRLVALTQRAEISDIVQAALEPSLEVDVYLKYRFEPGEGALLLTHAQGVPDDLRDLAARLVPDRAAGVDAAPILAAPAAELLRRIGARAIATYDLHAIDGAVLGALCFASTRRAAFGAKESLYFATLANVVSQAIERTEAEAALTTSRDTFRRLVEGSPFGVFTVDADFRLERFSQGARKMLGGADATEGEDFETVLRRVWPEPFASDALTHFRRVIATGEPYHSQRTVENSRDGDTQAYDWKVERILLPDGRFGAVCHFYDLSERVRYEAELSAAHERQAVLMRELAHRGKNLIAVIQAIASRSFTADRPHTESRAIFSGRLQALANTFATFSESSAESSPLRDILRAALEIYTDKVAIEGPELRLSAGAAQTFALIAHELATNAAKYGALSCQEGRVSVTWGVRDEQGEATFDFEWRESGGPPVAPPTRRSFGTVLISQIAGAQFGCAPQLDYDPGGLRYRFTASAARLGG